MQTPRPAPYDCVQAEKLLQQQVATLIQKEEECIRGIMTRKKTPRWWLLFPLLFVSYVAYQKIDNITKTMIRVSQTAREAFTPDTGSIQEIREQQSVIARDFALLAATMRELQQQLDERTNHNKTVIDSLEKTVLETQEKMEHAGEVASVLEKRLNDVQNAVEISVSTPTILDKRKKRALPQLTEVEGPRAYHAPTAASQAKNEKQTFVMGTDGMTKLQDL